MAFLRKFRFVSGQARACWCATVCNSRLSENDLNGWASTRRLQKHMAPCVFKCGNSSDCIEHYLVCPFVEKIWALVNRGCWGPFEDRLAVGCKEVEGRVARVFFLYGLYAAYNYARHGRLANAAAEVLAEVVKSHITFALGRSSTNIQFLYASAHARRVVCSKDSSSERETVGDIVFSFRRKKGAMLKAGGKSKNSKVKKVKKLSTKHSSGRRREGTGDKSVSGEIQSRP